MRPTSELAEASIEARGEDYRGPGANLELAAELGLLETLEEIKRSIAPDDPDPQLHRLILSASGDGQGKGNPADAVGGYRALSVWIANPNNFIVFVGAGAGTGSLERKLFGVPAQSWILAPIAEQVYSVGAAAADLAAADATVILVRFPNLLPPASGNIR